MAKVCARCMQTKPLDAFHRASKSPDGRQAWCKDCANAYQRANARHTAAASARWYDRGGKDKIRARNWKKNYGITPERYEEMKRAQNGRCAICGGTNPSGVELAVDHDHETGQLRALLCHACNLMLGNGADNPSRLEAGAAYLRRFGRR